MNELVEKLVDAFKKRKKIEPESLSISIDEAYEIQKSFVERIGTQIGWKIGASNEEVQRRLGINEPVIGRLLRETVLKKREKIENFIIPLGIEVEVAFKFHKTPEMSLQGILSSSKVAPVFEIINGVFSENPSVQHLIISNVRHAGVVFGEFRSCDFPLEHEKVELLINGKSVGVGSGKNVLGHPIAPLLWLMEKIQRMGEEVKKGDIVISGTMIPPIFIEEPSEIEARYSNLGTLEFKLL
jgi:2-keto-4-pentenoate hydratase